MFFAAPLLLAPLAWAATPKHLEQRQSDCSAVHIFLAKGNNEPYPGRQGTLVNAICSGLASCDYENILYYNPVEAPYCDSINEGVANGIAQITAYNKRCPDAKLVISGYSQGAQIVSDLLAGGGGNFFQGCLETTTAPLDINSAPGNKSKLTWKQNPESYRDRISYMKILANHDTQSLLPSSLVTRATLQTSPTTSSLAQALMVFSHAQVPKPVLFFNTPLSSTTTACRQILSAPVVEM